MTKTLHRDLVLGGHEGFGAWKILDGPNNECIVAPRSLHPVWILAAILIGGICMAMWFLPQVSFPWKVSLSFLGSMAGAGIIAFLIWFDHTQQRLGPCIVLTKTEILLRDDRHIDFDQFESFGTYSKMEESWDQSETTYLTLKCKNGEEVEILRSHSHGDVKKGLVEQFTDFLRIEGC